jgi:asparagine synthase (glutamine-hydrolysing)
MEPGNYLSYRHETGVVKRCYFDLNQYSRSTESNRNLEDFGVMLKEWLSKSVKGQLMSDVKLGCQLSGGIDSSLVTWLANRSSERGNFEAVSIIFNNPGFSEEKYIDRVTEKLVIPSHKFLLDSDYYFNTIEKATWHLEAPLNHPNTVAIYKLSQRAKEYVTVLLSGEGADEVFGGYSRFYDLSFPFHRAKLLHEIKKNLTHPIELIDYAFGERRAVMATAFITPTLAKKIKPNFNKERSTGNRRILYRSLSGSLIDRQVKYEMLSFLPDLLIRQDKMSMAHSIENRVPFLDNEVVKQSFTIPEKYLLLRESPEGSNTEKYLLKKMTSDVFGVDFAFRDKMGFGIPVREFFLNEKFKAFINDKVLPGIKSRDLFNHNLVAAWVTNLSNLKYFELEALWVTVAFEIWASIYLDGCHENWDTRS